MQGRYKLLKQIASGGSEVYSGQFANFSWVIPGSHLVGMDQETLASVAIKLESIHGPDFLTNESIAYRCLESRALPVPKMHLFTRVGDFRVLVMDRMGYSLEQLQNLCGGRFTLKTTLLLADQLLICLKRLHKCGIIHRDVKPGNCVLGIGKMGNNLHLIDLGLHCEPCEKRKQQRPSIGLIGTAQFASVSAHHKGGKKLSIPAFILDPSVLSPIRLFKV